MRIIDKPTAEWPEGSECPVHMRVHNAHGWYVCISTFDNVVESHEFVVTLTGCSEDEATRIMTDRIGRSPAYDFPYQISWRKLNWIRSSLVRIVDAYNRVWAEGYVEDIRRNLRPGEHFETRYSNEDESKWVREGV